MTAHAVKRIPVRKGLPSVSIQQDQARPAVPAVKENQSAEGDRPAKRWPPVWALALMYIVGIGAAIIFGMIFFGSH
jgi:hypothetical protein